MKKRDMFSLDDKKYYLDSIDNTSLEIIESITLIEEVIKKRQLDYEIALIAKDGLIKNLSKLSSNFEEVQEEVADNCDTDNCGCDCDCDT